MSVITSKEECELAASKLALSEITGQSIVLPGRPHGCIYGADDWLVWHDPLNSAYYPSPPCGSSDYDCLCKTQGNAAPFHL